MRASTRRSISDWMSAIFEGTIRGMVGCFILVLVSFVITAIVGSYQFNPFRGRLPTVGPRVPIPNVSPAMLFAGRRIYQREDCSSCHMLSGADPQDERYGNSNKQGYRSMPDLTHEGRRNADIDWQMSNLSEHHRLYPQSAMPDYNDLAPAELRALAAFLATRN